MTRASKREERVFKGSPLARQEHWPERPSEYRYWLDFFQGLTITDIAIKHNLSVNYLYQLSSNNLWRDRKVMVKAIQEHNAHHLTIPMEDFELKEGETNDLINSRVASASEVFSEDYLKTAQMHAKLIAHCEAALENIDTQNLSISELRALMSTANDMQKLKHDAANELLGIEEIAQVLTELQRKRNK